MSHPDLENRMNGAGEVERWQWCTAPCGLFPGTADSSLSSHPVYAARALPTAVCHPTLYMQLVRCRQQSVIPPCICSSCSADSSLSAHPVYAACALPTAVCQPTLYMQLVLCRWTLTVQCDRQHLGAKHTGGQSVASQQRFNSFTGAFWLQALKLLGRLLTSQRSRSGQCMICRTKRLTASASFWFLSCFGLQRHVSRRVLVGWLLGYGLFSSEFSAIASKPSGHCMYHQFNINCFYVLPTQCVYVFCVDLRTNSDYFNVQYWLVGFYNWDGVCLLRGTFYILRSAHTVCLCVLCGSENKERLFHCTALTGSFL